MIQDQVVELALGPSPTRSLDDIKKEYAQICGTAGDAQYIIEEVKAKLQAINQKLFELKQEYQKLENPNG